MEKEKKEKKYSFKTIVIVILITIVLMSSIKTIGFTFSNLNIGERIQEQEKNGKVVVINNPIVIENREKRLVLYFNGKIAIIGNFQLRSFHNIIDLKNQLISEGYSIEKVTIEYISHENDPYVFMVEIIEGLREFGFCVNTDAKL